MTPERAQAEDRYDAACDAISAMPDEASIKETLCRIMNMWGRTAWYTPTVRVHKDDLAEIIRALSNPHEGTEGVTA